MNLYLLVIIVIILLDWILDLFKYRAILSSLSPLVPDEFKDMVDAASFCLVLPKSGHRLTSISFNC